MERDHAGCSEFTKVEQEDSVERASLARYMVKKHNDHDLKADVDHIIKEKESVNIDVEKSSVSKEETELGQNNDVERIVSLHNTGKEKNKLADLKREKAMQTCINNVSEIPLSENKVEEHQDLSLDFKDRNRQVTQKQEHVLEMHETVHTGDYEDYKIKIGNNDVDRTASSNFVSVRGRKIVNKMLDLLIFLMSIYFPGSQPALPVKKIQVDRSGSKIICNAQVYDWIQSLTRIVHRVQADKENDMGLITTGFSGRVSSTALCHSGKLKAVLPHKDRNLDILKLLEPTFSHPYPDKKSHGKQCRREKCGDKKVQPSSPIKGIITPRNLLIPQHMSNKHHEVLRITVPQETLQPTGVYTEQGDKLLAISHNQSKATRLLCEEFKCSIESIQPIYSIFRNKCNFELPWNPSTAYEKKRDMTCTLMCNQRQSKDHSFKAINESLNIFDIHGGKEWTSCNKSFWPSDGKNQVDTEKWYLNNWSLDHPIFRNIVTVLAIPFGTEPLPPRWYITQNDYRYHYECVRLATFSQYRGSGFGTRLAQSGFVYDASRNMVVCPWDGSDVNEITRNEHIISCAFARQFYQINIPLHEAPSPPLPAAFGFDMAATMTFSPATEEQQDRIQSQTETDSIEVTSREELNQNAVSGLGQSSEGINAADIGPIGLTDQEERYCNNSSSLHSFNTTLHGMISQENDIDTNYTVHQEENSNADAISGADEGESDSDSQIDLEEILRENRRLHYAELCIICKIEPKCAVFVPCGHRLFCSECATSFRRCPACKKPIRNILFADLSLNWPV